MKLDHQAPSPSQTTALHDSAALQPSGAHQHLLEGFSLPPPMGVLAAYMDAFLLHHHQHSPPCSVQQATFTCLRPATSDRGQPRWAAPQLLHRRPRVGYRGHRQACMRACPWFWLRPYRVVKLTCPWQQGVTATIPTPGPKSKTFTKCTRPCSCIQPRLRLSR
ncbi:uncharacterized protein B0I36DRAFT_75721 [Microdochium trichocladiopsis]|uniref:Uncharacterized protein n=1 Tax=Microdochium trichocladiopsis TaxID=1682393 RepID=A0A9P8YF73_9PEZI|nr:uncharacterized protein B0I36DRAFT_75721 [Microdochium trichocladiopsis]KAH7038119.1 hypothetical protein B0I36DRAFT_75721 [Microdochium trichocladiopsis]